MIKLVLSLAVLSLVSAAPAVEEPPRIDFDTAEDCKYIVQRSFLVGQPPSNHYEPEDYDSANVRHNKKQDGFIYDCIRGSIVVKRDVKYTCTKGYSASIVFDRLGRCIRDEPQ